MGAAKTKTPTLEEMRDNALERIEQIELRIAARHVEIISIESDQLARATANEPPDREVGMTRVAMLDEQDIDSRVLAGVRAELGVVEQQIQHAEDVAALARVRATLDQTLLEALELADAYETAVWTANDAARAHAEAVVEARLALERVTHAAVMAREGVVKAAERVGEPAGVPLVPDHIERLTRDEFNVEDIPRARINAAAGRHAVQHVVEEVAAAAMVPRPIRTGPAKTAAELQADAIAEQQAKFAAWQKANGRPTSAQQREIDDAQEKNEARNNALAATTGAQRIAQQMRR